MVRIDGFEFYETCGVGVEERMEIKVMGLDYLIDIWPVVISFKNYFSVFKTNLISASLHYCLLSGRFV